jgi:ribosomal protein S18 acetylase RimI-like enzyme
VTQPIASAPPTLRPAAEADVDAIADIWHRGWLDAHLGRVPDTLLPHRGRAELRSGLPARLDTTTVATVGRKVVGFVTVHDDEIEQLYVDASARGTGIAGALLAHGESVIGAAHDLAWLAVVPDNARARRFYERCGWSDAGAFDNPAWTPGGDTIAVPSLRYEKALDLGAARRRTTG